MHEYVFIYSLLFYWFPQIDLFATIMLNHINPSWSTSI